MVLTTNQFKERNIEIHHNPFNFMVLETKHIKYSSILNFEQAIEILDLCNTVNSANKLYENAFSKEKINFSILYQAIQAILADEPFNDSQLVEYFKFFREYRKFTELMSDFSDIDEHFFYPQVDLHLLGFDLKIEKNIRFENIHTDLFDGYADLYEDMSNNSIEITDFIKAAKSLVKNIKEQYFLETA